MEPNTQRLIQGAAGAAGEKIYVEDVFSTYLYTGNGSTQTITNGIDLAGEGGLVWLKGRSSAISNYLYDTVNGGTSYLSTNTTGGLANTGSTVVDFGSTGFTFPSGNVSGENVNAVTYASWSFRKAPGFFDVVTYTGDGTAGRTVSHNLGSTPGLVVIKRQDSPSDWVVWHRSLSLANAAQGLRLNGTDALGTPSGGGTVWSSTTPMTSTTFGVASSQAGDWNTNINGGTYVAYLFAHDAGGFGADGTESVIKCGSFTTDGSAAATVNLGWEPQWLLTKATNTTGNWILWDTMRGMPDTSSGPQYLFPNLSNAEVTGGARMAATATGFDTSGMLGVSNTIIYIAIRRGPMKTPTDATEVFNTATGVYTSLATLTAADMVLFKGRSNDGQTEGQITDRLRGFKPFSNWTIGTTSTSPFLVPSSTAAEVTTGGSYTGTEPNGLNVFGNKNAPLSVVHGNPTNVSASGVNYSFRRAPRFFDVVATTSTGSSNQRIPHNLGVAPELIITKKRNGTSSWVSYVAPEGSDKYIYLNTNGIAYSSTNAWDPTATDFGMNNLLFYSNPTDTFIAYLFATCPAVSKVGSYTGTGTTLDVDCGFSAGARFVMIKRTDVEIVTPPTTGWYIWDTARGIVSGNDPYLLLNTTAPEATGTDYIDPLSYGFQISSSAPDAINALGGSYIFLAIA